MKTGINYKALKDLPKPEQRKVLADAVALELSKTEALLDIFKMQAVTMGGATTLKGPMFSANDPRNEVERIKSFLGRKYGTTSDTPQLNDVANQFAEFFHTNMPEMDMAFSVLFDLKDLRDSTHDHFDIADTNAGLTWTQRLPGQRTQIRKNISEALTTVSVVEYSDGLGILDKWLQFQQYWKIDEAIAEFRSTYFNKMAESHYGLLTALSSGVNQAFATDDTTTANNAAAAIIRACKAKGYAVGDNPTLYAACAIEHVGRLERMLTAQRGSAMVDQGTVSQPLVHRIGGIIGTTHVPADSSGYYLVLPGRKIQRGVWKDLTIETDRDVTASAENIVGVGQYNAAIGDSDQVRRVLFS